MVCCWCDGGGGVLFLSFFEGFCFCFLKQGSEPGKEWGKPPSPWLCSLVVSLDLNEE